MTWESWAWMVWLVLFGIVESIGIAQKDRPGHPRTLSAHVWWLIRGAGPWHHWARFGLLAFLAWLSVHLLSGGWV